MTFCTAINCMDGRVQLPVIHYMKKRTGAVYVDSITDAGPIGFLAENRDNDRIQSVLDRLKISVTSHNSNTLAIVGHHDCAGNPVDKSAQIQQLRASKQLIQHHFQQIRIICLWVNENWDVEEIDNEEEERG